MYFLDLCKFTNALKGQHAAIQRLQYVQNSAAQFLTKTAESEHITPVLRSHHWFPIVQQINFKLLITVFKAINCAGAT